MSEVGGIRLYRWALRCYPRPFREEYGADMVALLEEQLRDERRPRVWARLVADFSISVPMRHLEVHMQRPSDTVLPALFGGLSVAGVVLVLLGGSGATMAIGSILAVGSLVLAVLSWRDTRRPPATSTPSLWWKFLAAGLVGVGAFVVITSVIGELPDGAWPVAMAALVVAIGLTATGLILGAGRLGARTRS